MGNGTKVALVALLILMVVVIARFVRRGAEPVPDPAVHGNGAGAALRPDGKTKAQSSDVERKNVQRDAARREAAQRQKTTKKADKKRDTTRKALASERRSPPPRRVSRNTPPRPRARDGSGAAGAQVASKTSRSAQPGASKGLPLESKLPEGRSASGSGTAAAKDAHAPGGKPAAPRVPPVSVQGARGPELADGLRTGGPVSGTFDQPIGSRATPIGFRSGLGAPRIGSEGFPLRPTDRAPRKRDAASPPPSKPSVPVKPAYPKKHKIVKNDSFWKLAASYYGRSTPKLVELIQKANPGIDSKKMPLGKVLTIPEPPKDTLVASKSSASNVTPSKPTNKTGGKAAHHLKKAVKHEVQKNESLWSLAVRYYGDTSKIDLIRNANASLRYTDDIMAGSTIIIPPDR